MYIINTQYNKFTNKRVLPTGLLAITLQQGHIKPIDIRGYKYKSGLNISVMVTDF